MRAYRIDEIMVRNRKDWREKLRVTDPICVGQRLRFIII